MLARTAVFYRGFFIMSASILIGFFLGTQYVAHEYGYHPALGQPLLSLGAHKIYAPIMWLIWMFRFPEPAEAIYDVAYLCLLGSISVGIVIFISAVTMRSKPSSGKFGTARWAKPEDLKKYLGHSGVIIGTTGLRSHRRHSPPRYVCHDGPEHVALIAPSRSGKGATTIIPTLFRWQQSALVLDLKGENWIATSGWRSRFSTCFRFEPAAPGSAKFNPLQEIRIGHEDVSDADLIASMLVDPDGSKINPNYWDQSARIFLKTVILHCRYSDENASLASVKNWLNRPGSSMEQKLAEMASTRHRDGQCHPVVAQGVQQLRDKYFPEFSSILSTARSYLAIYDDTVLAENTSSSDFTIDQLVNAEQPMSLYIVFTPSDVLRLRFFLRLFVSMVVRKLTDATVSAGGFPHRHRCLFLLDEFPRLGNLPLVHDAIGYMAGYGLKCLIVAQSVKDLYRNYGREQTIVENCALRIFHATNDPDTSDYVSRLAGTATHREQEINISGHRLQPILTHAFVSEQESARPLITGGEVHSLPGDRELLFAPGIPPAKLFKIEWWKDPFLAAHQDAEAPSVPAAHSRPVNPWSGYVSADSTAYDDHPSAETLEENLAGGRGRNVSERNDDDDRALDNLATSPWEEASQEQQSNVRNGRLVDDQNDALWHT